MPLQKRIPERQALAKFVLDKRHRLTPAEVGIIPGGRRRTPGLRREEVAQIAGVGVTWYTWFEQGRDIRVSKAFLERLCQALNLNEAERHHLFMLAQHRPPSVPVRQEDIVPDAVQAVLNSLSDPAYVMTSRWDVLAWNRAASALFGDFDEFPKQDRNIIRLVFTNPAFQKHIVDRETYRRNLLEKFRMDFVQWKGDVAFSTLVDDLMRQSEDFARWWPQQGVQSPHPGSKRFIHPENGEVEYLYASFSVDGASGHRLVVFSEARHLSGNRHPVSGQNR